MTRWSTSPILTLKKSKFKGWCIPIRSNAEIPQLLKEIPDLDKNVLKASHPTMYAWKTANSLVVESNIKKINKKTNKTNDFNTAILNKLDNLNQGFHDNNEGGSGLRLLGMLDRIHLVNILVVVTRWYGGTPLGPARFKCISDVGMEALKIGGYLNNKPIDKGWIDCSLIKSKVN